MKKRLAALVLAVLALAAPPAARADGIPPGLRAEANAALQKAAAWLAARQQEDGHWSNPDTPALTALAFWALHDADAAAYAPAIDRALAHLLRFVRPDGSIFQPPTPERRGGGLANYNTAVCMMAIHALGRSDLVPVVQRARTFVAATQNLGESEYRGGMGYDPHSPRGDYADLSNSYMSYEAMRATQSVEDLRAEGDPKADLDWDAVQQFLAQVQNLPSVNPHPWAGADPDDLGGFVYTPNAGGTPAPRGPRPPEARRPVPPPEDWPDPVPESPRPPRRPAPRPDFQPDFRPGSAGGDASAPAPALAPPPAEAPAAAVPAAAPGIRLQSFGSMTYAGLLSLVYANVSRDDPRVTSAWDWARNHWTLSENPGKGPEGLFYFYNILVKCLDVFGDETIALPDGTRIPWRQDVLRQFLSLQQEDGSWFNAANRFWEGDPVLVTSYMILSIRRALGPDTPAAE
jgi:hypothetical protein